MTYKTVATFKTNNLSNKDRLNSKMSAFFFMKLTSHTHALQQFDKLVLRNQGQLAPFSAILFLRLETLQSTLLKLFEQKCFCAKMFLSNCSKQLVTPVNLTRKKNH